jgi:hypothetical protein
VSHASEIRSRRCLNARLKDKVAIVTGAGSRNDGIGTGRAAAVLYARDPFGNPICFVDERTVFAGAT